MASITMRKRQNGKRTFLIRCTIKGKSFTKTYPGKTDPPIPDTWSDKRARTEATKVAALFEDECRRGLVSSDKRTLSEYAHYVLDHKAANMSIKPSTVAGYNVILERIDEYPIAKVKLCDLDAEALNDYYASLLRDGANKRTGKALSPKTVREHHSFISAVLTEAVKTRAVTSNVASLASPPKVAQKEPNYYTPEQMVKIIEATNSEPAFWRSMTYLFMGIGARRGEILALRWSDIDFEACTIFIKRNVTRAAHGKTVIVTPKSDRWRVVSVSSDFLAPLRQWREEQAAAFGGYYDGFIFALKGPETYIQPDTITRYYARFGDKQNLGHLNPHAFRHSQASIILQSGDLVAASRRLGHAKASTTMNIYGHMLPAADRDAADRVARTVWDDDET